MTHASLWHKTDVSKIIARHYTEKYIHRLRWKDYKEDILEVGCAEGSITTDVLYPQIKERVRKLLAVDKLEEMVDRARVKNKIAEIDYQVLDIIDWQATKNYHRRFDHIFSLLVAHLIPDTRRFFAELHAMLKEGGQIFVTAVTENMVQRSVLKMWEEEKWKKYKPAKAIFADFTDDPRAYVEKILTDVGFRIDVCEHEPASYGSENFKDFARALVTLYVRLGGFPGEIEEDFIRQNVENSVAECTYLGEPDRYDVPCRQLICIATKTSRR